MPTFTLTAAPVHVEQHDGYSTVRFGIFQHDIMQGVATVSSPSDLAQAMERWANSLPLPTHNRHGEPVTLNAWSVSVVKPARWPSGYKQAGERSHTFVQSITCSDRATLVAS